MVTVGVGCSGEGESVSLAPEVGVESAEAADVAAKAAPTITESSDLAEAEPLSTASTLDLSGLSSAADGLGSSTTSPTTTSSSTTTSTTATSSTSTTVATTTSTSTTAAPTTTGSTVVTTVTTAAPTTTATTAAPTSESTTTAAPTTASTSAPTTTAVPTTKPPVGGDFDQAEAASLVLLNELRASLGLGSLTASDQEMSTFARSWSAEMSRSGFRHSSAGWAENIVWHSSDRMTPQEAAARFHDMWVNSPGHYRNMTNPNWTVAGVGLYRDSGGWWGTHVFR